MTPDLPKNPRDELESKLTALLLGELPSDEAFALGRAIEQDPELAKLYQRIKQTISLVRETEAPHPEHSTLGEPLKLSDHRREALLQQFKTVKPNEFKQPRRFRPSFLEIAAVLAISAVLAALLLPALSKSKSRAQRFAANSSLSLNGDASEKSIEFKPGTANSLNPGSPSAAPALSTISGGLADGVDQAAPVSVFDSTQVPKPQAGTITVNGATTYFGSERAGKDEKLKSPPPTIVLPPASESRGQTTLAFNTLGTSAGDGMIDANGRDAKKLDANSFAQTYTEGIGELETGKPAHSASNRFIGSYGIVLPPGAALDAEKFKNYGDLNRNSTFEITQADRRNEESLFSGDRRSAGNRGVATIGGERTAGEESKVHGTEYYLGNVLGRTNAMQGGSGGGGQFPGAAPSDVAGSFRSPQFDPATGFAMSLTDVPGQTSTASRARELAQDESAKARPEPSASTKQESSVPSLGELPAIGRLFRSEPSSMPPAAPSIAANTIQSISGGSVSTNMPLPNEVGLSIRDDFTFSAGKSLNKEIPAMQPEPALAGHPGIRSKINGDGLVLNDAINKPQIVLPPLSDDTYGFDTGKSRGEAANKFKLAEIQPQKLSPLTTDYDGDKTKPHLNYPTAAGSPAGKSIEQSGSETTIARGTAGPSNVYSLGIVGYAKVPSITTASVTGDYVHRAPVELARRKLGEDQIEQTRKIAAQQKEVEVLREKLSTSDAVAVADAPAITTRYSEAQRKLEELQRVNQLLAMKVAAEKNEGSLPRSSMVEIMDLAEPANKSSSTFWDKVRGKPATFESKARIRIARDTSDIPLSDSRTINATFDPYFTQTEFETIQSEAVLGRVVKDLNLSQKWAKNGGGKSLSTNETIAKLKGMLELKPIRNTSFVEIAAKSEKSGEAADIANSVASAYLNLRKERRSQTALAEMETVNQRLFEQEQKIAQASAEVDRLKPAEKSQEDKPIAKPSAPAPIPQPEVLASENPFSTFSLNVSDVSFKLAGASLEKGALPEPASIRSEEFINAFDYRDPEPSAGVPVAFASERARYPFAQNRDLLRFSIKTAALGREAGRPMNLVVLLDNSGSMERADRVRIIHEALRVLAAQLKPQDKLSIVTFSRTARLVVDGIAGDQTAQVADEVSGLTPQGGTNLEEAMNLAYQTALRHYLANGINRVVLLTDGAANLGEVQPESLKQKVEANRKQGIALDCFGIGWEGYNDDLLEVLSRNGDGRYGFINSPEEAASEFAGQLAGALHVAASDVKVQVEFNPKRVQAYRQIGYAKHQLTKEQFRDNTVDAAEIGAAESGNALYVIEVNPQGEGPLATVRCRYKVPGTSDYREQEWTVPFASNAVALDQATPAMRLAATASAFSEWLAASPYAAEVTTDRLLGYLSGVPEIYGADARPKKLEWMIRQSKSLGGK